MADRGRRAAGVDRRVERGVAGQQGVIHVATEAGNIANSGGIIGQDQQGFTGLHATHHLAHHHHRLRATQPQGIQLMLGHTKRLGHLPPPSKKAPIILGSGAV